jgi:hypothetical protein
MIRSTDQKSFVYAIDDRHIDHAKGSKLVSTLVFIRLRKVETELDGEQA